MDTLTEKVAECNLKEVIAAIRRNPAEYLRMRLVLRDLARFEFNGKMYWSHIQSSVEMSEGDTPIDKLLCDTCANPAEIITSDRIFKCSDCYVGPWVYNRPYGYQDLNEDELRTLLAMLD
jgi:hypothetical protein